MSLAQQFFTPVAGVVALIFAFVKTKWVNKHDVGTDKMREISGHIREGAMAFLNREYRILAVFALVVAALLGVANNGSADSHWLVAVAFLIGAVCLLAGYFGMNRNLRERSYDKCSSYRTSEALGVAFSGGTVMGMSVVGLGVCGVAGLTLLCRSECRRNQR